MKIYQQYSVSELFKTAYSWLMTKLFFRDARLIRRPIYLRGGGYSGGRGLTTGRFCRFDLAGNEALKIGTDCEFGDFTHIVAHKDVRIGSGVLAASKVFISDTDHGSYKGTAASIPDIPPKKRKLVSGHVVIGNHVWIGENAVILSGAEIGDGCVIGANSVISKRIPANSIAVGHNKVIRQYCKQLKSQP